MIWQPTMRVWAGDEVKIDEKELEAEPMEGIEVAIESKVEKATGNGSGAGSARSQSMSVSSMSVSGKDEEA